MSLKNFKHFVAGSPHNAPKTDSRQSYTTPPMAAAPKKPAKRPKPVKLSPPVKRTPPRLLAHPKLPTSGAK